MRKFAIPLLALFALTLTSHSFAEECDPGLKADFKLNTGGFDAEKFKKDNKPEDDPKGTLMVCFMGTTSGGMSPDKVFNETCGCKEKIKKFCKIKKGKLKPDGVPKAWCAPFLPYLK